MLSLPSCPSLLQLLTNVTFANGGVTSVVGRLFHSVGCSGMLVRCWLETWSRGAVVVHPWPTSLQSEWNTDGCAFGVIKVRIIAFTGEGWVDRRISAEVILVVNKSNKFIHLLKTTDIDRRGMAWKKLMLLIRWPYLTWLWSMGGAFRKSWWCKI